MVLELIYTVMVPPKRFTEVNDRLISGCVVIIH
jgi:hypothetical protein